MLQADESRKPVLCASRTATPPVIDGKMSKGEWPKKAAASGFKYQGIGAEAREPTAVFVTYDDKNLYFCFRCSESNVGQIVARLKKHGSAVWRDDFVSVNIDATLGKAGFSQFLTNSIGTRYGARGKWRAAAKVHRGFWCAEIAIAFSALRIPAEDGRVCGLELYRGKQGGYREKSYWAPAHGDPRVPTRYGYMVLGSLQSAAVRRAGVLETRLAKAAGEKARKAILLRKIKKLKTLPCRTKKDFMAMRTVAAAIEKQIVRLEESAICKKVAPVATTGKIFLTSDAARSGYELPENWRLRKILGRDFWHDISSRRMSLFRRAGFVDEPFIKDSLLTIPTRGNAMFERVFLDPKSKTRKMLKETGRAFCIPSPHGSYAISRSSRRKFLDEFGGQFVGFIADECYGHNCRARWKQMKLPMPKTRHEAFMGFAALFLERRRGIFRNWALCYVDLRPWTICTFSSPMDHYVLELGPIKMSGAEIGGHPKSTAMMFAFSRGAARQYDKPWRIYLALYGMGVISDSTNGYRVLSPRCRNATRRKRWDTGPNSGTSLSLQKRQILAAYMSGMNLFHDEGDSDCGSVYVANYDYRTIDSVDDLVIVLRDKPYCLSPAGVIRKEFYDNIVKKHDRGAIYTPVALVFDRYHGYMPKHYPNHVQGAIPYKEADYMMRAVNEALFPWESRMGERQAMVTGPFGDMFDVLTNNTPSEVLSTYGAAMLVGNVELDGYFVQRLVKYVENGGTLIVNARQIKGKLSKKFQKILGCKVTKKRGRGKIAFSNLDNSVILEKKPFNFQYLQPTTATTLVSLIEGDKKTAPLVLSNKYGKGRVIVTSPDYLKEPGSKTQMLRLFSHLMRRLNSELLPVAVEGNVEYIVNRNKNGWVVTLINNDGVYKYPGQKPIVKSEKNVAAKVTLKRNAAAKVSKVSEWLTGKELKFAETPQGTKVTLTVPAGKVRIIEFEL
ncbi:MAG: hypothetical protein K8S55_08220 [Phycisphaerae bacterium]|nr:hypothetical protein [Phycisphaerae bacterium]